MDVARTALNAGYETPMFRGSVMGSYEDGRWQVLPESRQWRPMLTTTDRRGIVRQQYVLTDSAATTLFGMHPIVAAEKTGDGDDVGIDVVTSILQRSGNRSRGQTTYSLFSFQPTAQPKPRVLHMDSNDAFELRMSLMDRFRSLPPNLGRLKTLAQDIRKNVPTDDERAFADAVQAYLSDAGRFEYSLKADITDPMIDPVEDFLFNRRTGHCEYFASAMALMLRSQGIPTRLVSGYKGGDKNAYSGAFIVEQRHAHAWVEAFVRDRWYTFDPTPAGREDVVRQIGNQRSLFAEMRETLTGLWTKNVMQMSLEQQMSEIYEPAAKSAATKLNRMPTTKAFLQYLRAFARDPLRFFSPRIWFLTVLLLGAVYGVMKHWRRALPQSFSLRRWLKELLARISSLAIGRVTGRRVDFYERLEKILRRNGFNRSPSQTPLEFIASIEPQLQNRLSDPELKRLPTDVTLRFYAVRFGDCSLDAADAAQIQAQLNHFELALKSRTTSPS